MVPTLKSLFYALEEVEAAVVLVVGSGDRGSGGGGGGGGNGGGGDGGCGEFSIG